MNLCGCCGNPARPGLDWCQACIPHLAHGEFCFGIHEGDPVEAEPCTLLHVWMQSFYAQTQSHCPYSVEWK